MIKLDLSIGKDFFNVWRPTLIAFYGCMAMTDIIDDYSNNPGMLSIWIIQ